jgi:hypothetical protein
MANGYIAYDGPSMINGEPIKGIVTGTKNDSVNPKTGVMLQLTIMPMVRPSIAVKNGADVAVCGSCPKRPSVAKANGTAPCYVNTWQAPDSIFKAEYPTEPVDSPKPMRLGAWGEPTALPFEVIQGLIGKGHTGYTHRWKECDSRFKAILMASVDTAEEYAEATAAGWRTFRARDASEEIISGEITCPASKEAGNRVQCKDCMLCQGAGRKAKNITIINH